jgi:hypothetical protein
MKRTQVAALLAGAALGLTGLTVAVALSRKEGRAAARDLLAKTQPVAVQAKRAGGQIVKTASEQYQVLAPKAAEVVQAVREQMPHAVETLSGVLPRLSPNGKQETAETIA